MKKLQTELTNEELLKLLENNEEPPTKKKREFRNDVLNFIGFYNIKTGTEMVPRDLLFNLYKQRGGVKNRKGFTSTLGKFVPKKKFYHKSYFLIDQSSLEISEKLKNALHIPDKLKLRTNNHQKRHIESFIKYFNLKTGAELIPAAALYNIYDLWCYKNKAKTRARPIFSRLLQFYIPIVKLDRKFYYRLDKSFYNVMTKKQIENLVRKHNEKK